MYVFFMGVHLHSKGTNFPSNCCCGCWSQGCVAKTTAASCKAWSVRWFVVGFRKFFWPNWDISPVVWSRFNLTRWIVFLECPMLISHVGPWNNSFNFICLISNAGKNLNVTLVGWANLHGSSNLPIPSRWAPSPVIGRGSPPITKAISPVKPFTKVI